jgi:acetyl esterase/lipase
MIKAQDKIIKLWPEGVPNSIENSSYIEFNQYDKSGKLLYALNIKDPVLEIFFPPKEKANGSSVIICPGGGYKFLSLHNEGYPVAKWLNSLGITAFILKSRLPSDSIMIDKSIAPLQDAQRAMEIVRKNAGKWKLNPDKTGIIGFSAGGHLAAMLSVHYDEKTYNKTDSISVRPDFTILIYPVISMTHEIAESQSRINLLGKNPEKGKINYFSCEMNINSHTPPAFIVHAEDDNVVPETTASIIL